MKILFLAQHKSPHVGGVERHIDEVLKPLEKRGFKVTVVSSEDINFPKVKHLGLLYIWFWLWKNRNLINDNELIHCHDVFIWYLPFRFIYPNKKVVTTFHGLEWDSPLRKISIWQKRLASRLSTNTIGVGRFLEKYLGIKFDLLIYGATTVIHSTVVKKRMSIIYVGRLEENTGLGKFLGWLDKNNKYKVEFCGDGRMRSECEKYGNVYGFTDPIHFLKKAEYCVPGGYLAALEALSYKCKLKLFWNNKIKEDYWKMSPFVKKNVKVWVQSQTWDKLADEYINLYNSI